MECPAYTKRKKEKDKERREIRTKGEKKEER